MKRRLQLFLSYSRDDQLSVRQLYKRLLVESFIDPWFDQEKILPGQDWRYEIERAIEKADVGLLCISSRSITKEGFLQRELRNFVDRAEEKPEGTIFLIPIKLDQCTMPLRLSRWQWVDFFDDAAYEKLVESLQMRARQLGIDIQVVSAQPQETQESIFTPLDKTMSNPHYFSDTKRLDANNYELSSVVQSETILIVVGCWIPAELCDRPVAEMIRDEIDKRGRKDTYRRAVIVSDTEWSRNAILQRCPVIAVGGPTANSLTNKLEQAAPENFRWRSGRTSRVFAAGPPPQIALWGVNGSDTARCAETFLQEPEVLDRFLQDCWSSWRA